MLVLFLIKWSWIAGADGPLSDPRGRAGRADIVIITHACLAIDQHAGLVINKYASRIIVL